MIQRTYNLKGIDELDKTAAMVREKYLKEEKSAKVLFAWAQIWDDGKFEKFQNKIKALFFDFTVIGSNHYSRSDVLKGQLKGPELEEGIMLSFLFFESSSVSLLDTEGGMFREKSQGMELYEKLKGINDIKAMYLCVADYFCYVDAILKEAMKGMEEVAVFGIKTSPIPEYKVFGFEPGGEVKEHCVFALVFCGSELKVRINHNFGWTPVGKVMTVTREENPFIINEIDGEPASHVYNKYLGLPDEQIIPQNICEFPIVVDRDGFNISRIGITGQQKGQLFFGAPIYQGERIRLSYANPDDLFAEAVKDSEEIKAFEPEAELLIVCVNRVLLLKEREEEEIKIYRKDLHNCAAVYGYAEIMYVNGRGGELNSALVSVVMKEEVTDRSSKARFESEEQDTGSDPESGKNTSGDVLVPFEYRISRFFKEMSEDLIKAVEESEAANRTKSLFYSCISHEIRTPLNAILGMNEMILRESRDPGILKYAEDISGSGRLLLQLINDILDTEKIEAGKMEIVPIEYDLNKMINALINMVSYSAENKGLKLELQIEGELPKYLYGDETRVRQCAINLLNNAVKYTEKGEVILKVSCTGTDNDNVMLNICVKDTGIGVRPEDIEKLSLPFNRLDMSRNYNIEGTGLGLSIVKNLLSLMGSELNISSIYGEGSEFSFGVIQQIGKTVMEETERKGKATDLKEVDSSVLIVDDNPVNIKLMRLFLKDSRMDIDSASNGFDAIEMCQKKKYDLIFLDHRMPEMDGGETFKRIKKYASDMNGDSVYIMLTANDEPGIRDEFIREGFDDFISKPIKINELEEMIHRHIF
ncbi:MAG: response regulator [Lachnospiraceae bacterium]|nr:response regulator [Lachnospiraceae bacterium]